MSAPGHEEAGVLVLRPPDGAIGPVAPSEGAGKRTCAAAADPAVQRAREAGGPVDMACYSCECGYQFQAPVSTTVTCPHCGTGQAW